MIGTKPVPAFHEEWFPGRSQEVLAGLVHEVAQVPGIVVEFGAWEGRSTCALANAAFPRLLLSCDTWEGSPGEISADLASRRDVFAQWQANVGHWTRGNVIPHRKGWRQFMAELTDDVALAFIDAEHTYREVHDNVIAVLRCMAVGGIICGDDAHHPPAREAIEDVFGREHLSYDATLWIWRAPR